MLKKNYGNIVFILGMPRSGTTILQRIINSSDQVCSYPETWFFASHLEKLNYKNGISRIGYKVSARALNSFLRNNSLKQKYLETIRYTYLKITNESNKYKYILEKTPANLLVWQDIFQLINKNDKIIIIERPIMEIYKSMVLHFDKFPYFKNLKLYKDAIEYQNCINALKLSKHKNYLAINYDNLITDSKSIIKKINNYLELSDVSGLGDIKEYNGKTLGDINARNSKKLKKRIRKTPYLLNKISKLYFEKRISFTGLLLFLIGKIALKFNGRTINKGNQIHY